MSVIALEGLGFYAFHGVHEAERLIGNEYIVDIYLTVNFDLAASTDDLNHTINYETIYRIVKIEMKKTAQLLETVARRICGKITALWGREIQEIRLRLSKKNPPLPAKVNSVYVEIVESGGQVVENLLVLEGLHFHAFHGFYEQERLAGNDYVVEIELTTDIQAAAATDNLDNAVNYETVYQIVRIEMQKPSKLLESVAKRIIDNIILICARVQHIRVQIKKKNPPMGARVNQSLVELEKSFVVACSKCKRPFIVQQSGDSWTKHGMVYPETRATLSRLFGSNICKNCLKPYFIKEK